MFVTKSNYLCKMYKKYSHVPSQGSYNGHLKVFLQDIKHTILLVQSATLDATPEARITICCQTILDVKQTR